jgi:hypothetical protein
MTGSPIPGIQPETGWRWLGASGSAFAGDLAVWQSENPDDPVWDEFLLGNSRGQFLQSSAWGRVKQLEGWRISRFICTGGQQITAGVQFLWKTKYGLRLGYVNKGPVVADQAGLAPPAAVELVKHAARQLRLTAVMIQAPDFAGELDEAMSAASFVADPALRILGATVLVNLARPFEEVERDFSETTRYEIRKHRQAGVQLRVGDENDAALFFHLMCATCARQNIAPNPGRMESIRAILHEFGFAQRRNSAMEARLLFARHPGQETDSAGVLLLRFGRCLSIWKKGAILGQGVPNPGRLLEYEAMRWGKSVGCQWYDLVGFDRTAAQRILAGENRKQIKLRSMDEYKLFFGGNPVLLPKARLWIPNRWARSAFKTLCRMRRGTTSE